MPTAGNVAEILAGGLLVPCHGAVAEMRTEGGSHPARRARIVVGKREAVQCLEVRISGRPGGLALAAHDPLDGRQHPLAAGSRLSQQEASAIRDQPGDGT